MTATPRSPVSPIEMTPPSRPVQPLSQNTNTTIDNTSIPNQTVTTSPNQVNTNWMPFTFRWYFLLLPILTSLAFGVTILVLVRYSQQNHGLGGDDGSSAILFGWRFTPTLLAVLYTQMTVILFEDAKRTEPFARLAKAPATGASASGTVLQTPRAWWSIFRDFAFRRKKTGKTSWCLFCTALVNVLALLVISPLSSALLTSEEISITQSMDFNTMVPKNGIQLLLSDSRETYFRTMAALMRNISTSAWITDTSVTLPFWPSTEQAQFGSSISSPYRSWTTETTSLHHGLDCQNMTLKSAELVPKRYLGYDVLDHGPYKGTENMVAFNLQSADGCNYELAVHPSSDLAYNGGVRWSNSSTYYLGSDKTLHIGNIPFASNVSSTSPYVQFNASAACRDREIVIISTPWTKPFKMEYSQGPSLPKNKTYYRSSDFRMRALVCESRYTTIQRDVTVTMHLDGSSMVGPASNNVTGKEISMINFVDIKRAQSLALHNGWWDYFNFDSVRADADKAQGAYEQPYGDPAVAAAVPAFNGMGPILGSLYSFNITSILDDGKLVEQMQRIRGRFFAECLHGALNDPRGVSSQQMRGQVTLVQERVVVLREIGITMGALFLVSALLIILIFCSSGLRFRPLNLSTDPGSTVGLSMLLQNQPTRLSIFRSQHRVAKPEFHRNLRSETFFSTNGSLHTSSGKQWSNTGSPSSQQKANRWHPLVVRLRLLLALCCSLALVLVAILVLSSFSAKSRLSQLAFIYEADVSKLGLSFSTFAPISIAPTVVSIIVGLWWDQLDMTIRILQPYIAMSRHPTPINAGAGLTYRSKTWIGAAIKAARNKHWMLFMIAIGSVWCQVLTVSMSALFERQYSHTHTSVTLGNELVLRQDPIVTTIRAEFDSRFENHVQAVLANQFLDPPKNWLPGATIQASMTGTILPWAQNGWSFLPLDFESIRASSSSPGQPNFPTNITVTTQALRARLDCSPIPEISDPSSFLTKLKSNQTWDTVEKFPLDEVEGSYVLSRTIFKGTIANTSAFTSEAIIGCCANGTDNNLQQSVFGFWSPTDVKKFPHVDEEWPQPFVTKWIVGKPQALSPIVLSTLRQPSALRLMVFKEFPAIQAARCVPKVEAASAEVLVDRDSGVVYSHNIKQGSILPAKAAWIDTFIHHQPSGTSQLYNNNYTGPLNMTTSYGVLFMDTLLNAADITNRVGFLRKQWQSPTDKSFVFRDEGHGMNMDLMTYSMYSMANKDPKALLNYTTLVAHADRTLQIFFQHFVRNGLSSTKGGLAYQNVNDRAVMDLGQPFNSNGTAIPRRTYPTTEANTKVEAVVTSRIRVLHMNSVATYLSVAILIWLIGTTAVVTCLQRKYTSPLIRDVQLIADVLVLVAGSDNLLELIDEKGISLKKNRDIKTMLGWFRDSEGQVRWGVEVVGGRNAVQWVDAPKQGFHVAPKPARRQWWRSLSSLSP